METISAPRSNGLALALATTCVDGALLILIHPLLSF